MILSPTSQIGYHHKITNITLSPTSLTPNMKLEIYSDSFLSNFDKNFRSEMKLFQLQAFQHPIKRLIMYES